MGTWAAVVTTGIYCRPGCSAQPRADNVRAYALPAAAEAAGYRACLRCRPYRLPQIGIWASGSELVCRAVGLILDGALDGGTEAELGRRLGVSARHLRRLFVEHLGVTPDGLARSARTHFARRLLDDTDLTILDIAYAAGFGSVRQLNRACRQIFRMSPRELRARRRLADRLVADGGLPLRLPYSGPLDWQALVSYFAATAVPGVERVSGDVYRRTIVVDGEPGVLELLPGADDHLLLRAHLPRWRELIHIVERARRIASLDLDLDGPRAQLATDPVVGPLVRARPGLRMPGTWDPFETGVRAIVAHEAAGDAVDTIMRLLVERLGTPVGGLAQFGLTHTFPSAETVASADLRGVGLGRRTKTVRAFAEAVVGGAVRLDRAVGLGELVASLVAIDGVAETNAQYVALRLGERDAYPLENVAAAERWRPWRALAAAHLWLGDIAQAPGFAAARVA